MFIVLEFNYSAWEQLLQFIATFYFVVGVPVQLRVTCIIACGRLIFLTLSTLICSAIGCGRRVRVLRKATVGHSFFCSELLW